jgi:heme exporter protein C
VKAYYKILVFVILSGVCIAGFMAPIDFIPGLGERARNLFFHVPMSWVAAVAFLMSMIFSIRYLMTKNMDFDIKAHSSAEIGLLFCVLGYVTGTLWARVDWGTFFKIDEPRMMSILLLMLIYAAYLILRSSIDEEEKKARLSAVYLIIAFLTVPFFIFIMPRVFPGLHPGSADDAQSPGGGPVVKNEMNSTMRVIFYTSSVGFVMLYVWIYNLRVRIEKLTIKKLRSIAA